jgi:polysaccharide export outer membrane protein
MGVGCAQQRVYQAAKLPPEYAAAPIEMVKPDLTSRLAQYKGSQDRIEPGDLLDVTIDAGYAGEPIRTRPIRVADDGTIRLTLIGSLPVAGLRLEDAEREVYAAAVRTGMYRDPGVTVEMKQRRMHRVKVIGAVAEPGVKELPRNSSYLLDALVAAGNVTASASPDIEIRRPEPRDEPRGLPGPRVAQAAYATTEEGPRIVQVNLTQLSEESPRGHYLEDGDVVVVKERPPRTIHVTGLVRKPGEYDAPYDREVHLIDALAMAGGRTMEIADKVWIIRRVPGEEAPLVIETSVRKAKRDGSANPRLMAGDVVSVEETPATFVLDLLKGFVRFGFSSALF